MSLLRSALLWASTNPTLARKVPEMGFVRSALRRFMPGEELDDALAAARDLARAGLPTTFTHLGENVTDAARAAAAADHYAGALDRIREEGLDTEISVKLTHLGLDVDLDLAAGSVSRLAARAAAAGTRVWIDMESAPYVDPTLEVYRRARDGHDNVGVCLQAYLWRTPDDVARIMERPWAVRLVKGAYREPAAVAATGRAVDDRFLALAVAMLPAAAAGSGRLALATHDTDLLDAVAVAAGTRRLPRSAWEIQMLYGIRMEDQRRLVAAGFAVRDLVAYGSAWYPWYVRRLAERPANLWFVARNLIDGRAAG